MSDIQQSKILCQKKKFSKLQKKLFRCIYEVHIQARAAITIFKKKSKKFPNLIPISLHTYPIINTKKQIVIGAFEP